MWELVEGSPVCAQPARRSSCVCLGMIFSESRFPLFRIMLLERQQHIHHLLTVARLLHVHQLAVAAIGDAGLRDLA
jgi:hypothetical protein